MVVVERDVDLRADDRQTKELKRIADRVRKIAVRDYSAGSDVAVIIAIKDGEAIVKIGVELEEELIKVPEVPEEKVVTDEEALATLESS